MSDAERPSPAARMLALGDSYTVGEGVDAVDAWPMQLARTLRTRGIPVAEPTIVARTGWTTDELRVALDVALEVAFDVAAGAALAPPYDLVTLLIGVNDQYRGRPVDDFRHEIVPLVARAVSLAGQRPERVVALSIPDWSVTPFAAGRDRSIIAEEIAAYNVEVETAARLAGARLVDITPSSRRAGDDASLLAADGLHPSARMYAAWTRLVLPVAAVALDTRDSGRA